MGRRTERLVVAMVVASRFYRLRVLAELAPVVVVVYGDADLAAVLLLLDGAAIVAGVAALELPCRGLPRTFPRRLFNQREPLLHRVTLGGFYCLRKRCVRGHSLAEGRIANACGSGRELIRGA